MKKIREKDDLTEYQINANWSRLLSLVERYSDRRYLRLLKDLGGNVSCFHHPKVHPGFREAPAATGNHHARKGGLVQHLLEMWKFHTVLNKTLKQHFTNKEVLECIILHDLEKACRTFVETGLVGRPYVYDDDFDNKLTTGTVKSLWIAMDAGIKPSLKQVNALEMAHGGYTNDPPKGSTPLAKYIYILDELSGNVLDRIKTKREMKNSGRFIPV